MPVELNKDFLALSKLEQDIEALEQSIIKWERNAKVQGEENVSIGPSDCPLCRLYYNRTDICGDCPIFQDTGRRFCKGTPYAIVDHLRGSVAHIPCTEKALEDFRDAAKDEVVYLKGLLEKLKAKREKE